MYRLLNLTLRELLDYLLFSEAISFFLFFILIFISNRMERKHHLFWEFIWLSIVVSSFLNFISNRTGLSILAFQIIWINLQSFVIMRLAKEYRKSIKWSLVFAPVYLFLPLLLISFRHPVASIYFSLIFRALPLVLLGLSIERLSGTLSNYKKVMKVTLIAMAAKDLFFYFPVFEGNLILSVSAELSRMILIFIFGFSYIALRKETEQKMREFTEGLLQDILQNVPDPVFRIDSERKILYSSQRFRDMLERPGIDSIEKLVFEEDRRKFIGAVERAVIEDGLNTLRVRLEIQNEPEWYEIAFRGLCREGKRVIDIFCHDIQTQVMQQKLLEREKEELERLSQSQSAFFSNISHELRTPLTIIMGYAETMKEDLNISRSRMVDTIIDSARYQLKLVNDILDLSKLNARMLKPEIVETSIYTLLMDEVDKFREMANSKGLVLRTDFEELPEAFHTDPLMLIRIIHNLLDNAIRFTDRGEILLIARSEGKGALLIKVKDTGTGIEKEHIEKVFERFFQSKKTGRRKGTGLGLALTRELVQLLSGKIWIESEPGKGTTVFFTLKDMKAG